MDSVAGMDLHLSGKRAIVAGGSKGIGLAIARGLAAEGVDIAILARTERTVVSVARDLVSEFGIRAIGVVTDTRDDDAVQASVRQVVEEFGGGPTFWSTPQRLRSAPESRRISRRPQTTSCETKSK